MTFSQIIYDTESPHAKAVRAMISGGAVVLGIVVDNVAQNQIPIATVIGGIFGLVIAVIYLCKAVVEYKGHLNKHHQDWQERRIHSLESQLLILNPEAYRKLLIDSHPDIPVPPESKTPESRN